jgi:CRP-like cAMP-binding protein
MKTINDRRWLKECAGARTCRLAVGETLFRRGDSSWGMFILETGQVRLRRYSPDGAEVTMQAVAPGESFAEPSLFSSVYHCDCVATRESVLTVLPRTRVLRLLKNDPNFASSFARQMACQLQLTRTRLELRSIRSADERVFAALVLISDGRKEVTLNGTLKDFASELGLTHEAVYRALARIQRTRRIRRKGRRITLR